MLDFDLTNYTSNLEELRKKLITELKNTAPVADNPEYINIINKYPQYFLPEKENMTIACNMIAFDLEYETQKYLSNGTTNPKKNGVQRFTHQSNSSEFYKEILNIKDNFVKITRPTTIESSKRDLIHYKKMINVYFFIIDQLLSKNDNMQATYYQYLIYLHNALRHYGHAFAFIIANDETTTYNFELYENAVRHQVIRHTHQENLNAFLGQTKIGNTENISEKQYFLTQKSLLDICNNICWSEFYHTSTLHFTGNAQKSKIQHDYSGMLYAFFTKLVDVKKLALDKNLADQFDCNKHFFKAEIKTSPLFNILELLLDFKPKLKPILARFDIQDSNIEECISEKENDFKEKIECIIKDDNNELASNPENIIKNSLDILSQLRPIWRDLTTNKATLSILLKLFTHWGRYFKDKSPDVCNNLIVEAFSTFGNACVKTLMQCRNSQETLSKESIHTMFFKFNNADNKNLICCAKGIIFDASKIEANPNNPHYQKIIDYYEIDKISNEQKRSFFSYTIKEFFEFYKFCNNVTTDIEIIQNLQKYVCHINSSYFVFNYLLNDAAMRDRCMDNFSMFLFFTEKYLSFFSQTLSLNMIAQNIKTIKNLISIILSHKDIFPELLIYAKHTSDKQAFHIMQIQTDYANILHRIGEFQNSQAHLELSKSLLPGAEEIMNKTVKHVHSPAKAISKLESTPKKTIQENTKNKKQPKIKSAEQIAAEKEALYNKKIIQQQTKANKKAARIDTHQKNIEHKAEQQKLEQQRLEKQKAEQQKGEQQKLEQQRLEQQKAEQLKLEQQKLEQQRLEQQKAEQLKLEQQKLEQQKLEQQKAEQQKPQNKSIFKKTKEVFGHKKQYVLKTKKQDVKPEPIITIQKTIQVDLHEKLKNIITLLQLHGYKVALKGKYLLSRLFKKFNPEMDAIPVHAVEFVTTCPADALQTLFPAELLRQNSHSPNTYMISSIATPFDILFTYSDPLVYSDTPAFLFDTLTCESDDGTIHDPLGHVIDDLQRKNGNFLFSSLHSMELDALFEKFPQKILEGIKISTTFNIPLPDTFKQAMISKASHFIHQPFWTQVRCLTDLFYDGKAYSNFMFLNENNLLTRMIPFLCEKDIENCLHEWQMIFKHIDDLPHSSIRKFSNFEMFALFLKPIQRELEDCLGAYEELSNNMLEKQIWVHAIRNFHNTHDQCGHCTASHPLNFLKDSRKACMNASTYTKMFDTQQAQRVTTHYNAMHEHSKTEKVVKLLNKMKLW